MVFPLFGEDEWLLSSIELNENIQITNFLLLRDDLSRTDRISYYMQSLICKLPISFCCMTFQVEPTGFFTTCNLLYAKHKDVTQRDSPHLYWTYEQAFLDEGIKYKREWLFLFLQQMRSRVWQPKEYT